MICKYPCMILKFCNRFVETFYKDLEEALGHKSSLEMLSQQLEAATKEEDPYAEQIADMRETGTLYV